MAIDKPASNAQQGYRCLNRRRAALLWACGVLVLLACLADVATGPAMLSLQEVLGAVFRPAHAGSMNSMIIWTFRLPTALFAVLVGASLGLAGAGMQTILDNPLASPYTLGISAAAGFGAALTIVFGATPAPGWIDALAIPTGAFICAMLSALAIWAVACLRRASLAMIILCGVALSFFFSSALAFLQYIATDNQLQAIVFWMFGSLQGATWPKLAIVAAMLLVFIPFFAAQAWPLTALRLGENRARSLGINVQRVRLQTLILTSMLTAAAVCFAGSIGFIGLVAPHLARMLAGEDQRFLMPLSATTGALLLAAASLASKSIVPGSIVPIGIVTSAIGVPFFAVIVLGKRRISW